MQETGSSTANFRVLASRPTTHDHIVQFYENENFLCEEVSRYLALGLRARQPLIVIATQVHRDAFIRRLKAQGFDVDTAVATGRFTLLDARETLTSFMVDGMPDTVLFQRNVGSVIESSQTLNDYLPVRAFGEMVDLLWREGSEAAAIRLEKLWNDLATQYSFSLFCAYQLGNFSSEKDSDHFLQLCGEHARVIPTESYSQVTDDDARLREVSFLQHRALALENEIRERKEVEKTLRQALEERDQVLARERAARQEAERASRTKDEFLAVLSHELRTPLTAMVGWARIIASGPDEAMLRRGVEVIQRNADLQVHLINDLLDVSRIISGKMVINSEPVDLQEVVNAAIDIVRPAAEARDVDLNVQLEEAARFIKGDSGRLQQVVWNLLSNAIKFTPAGGRVELRLEAEQNGSHVQLLVVDNGKGISPEFLPHVFERFRQENSSTTREHGGLGLGLTIVRYLVEAHGGAVSVRSGGEGHGATFIVRLPILGTS